MEMHCLNSLSTQENAEVERQQRREEKRVNREPMQMIDTSSASMAAARASRNKTVSAVFRPGQQPTVEGLCKEQVEAPQEEEEEFSPPKQL